ncbi:winged helix DNA-binding domain-containing protein [Rhodococcus spelaei]|uniref:Winged helix DNA-binding domain-containing protein n=1 Tax=Rhodococcus spelaei TaxID=2546320 RepID=A0A541AZQ0_9NOCA|nr:winged helix DNA-binding domain-containing protein [Rhodococcus spelaei]TQF65549.1 winged helix DNA-binding domain-containing protein [Rhodococcus spelaei]
MSAERLSRCALGRATLARQHLLSRSPGTAREMVEHLFGLQAQAPLAPYYALWARLERFEPDDFGALLEGREVVRMALMRGTVHAVSSEDAAALRQWVQPLMTADLRTNAQHRKEIAEVDVPTVERFAREVLERTPMTMVALRPHLAERWPDRDPAALAHAVRDLLPLVQIPPRGLWGRSGQPVCTTLESWLGAPLGRTATPEVLVLRYLAAFGPASVADAQAWSGLTRLSEVFEALAPRLRRFVGEDGAELYDLADAPRPDPATPAPTRILAPFDSALLGHADRSRIITDDHRKLVFTVNGIIKPTVLLGGTVAGFVTVAAKQGSASVEITTFTRPTARDCAALESEALRLLAFAHPGADTHDVRFAAVG